MKFVQFSRVYFCILYFNAIPIGYMSSQINQIFTFTSNVFVECWIIFQKEKVSLKSQTFCSLFCHQKISTIIIICQTWLIISVFAISRPIFGPILNNLVKYSNTVHKEKNYIGAHFILLELPLDFIILLTKY